MKWGVNWQDGMKICAENFLDERRYSADLMSKYAQYFVNDFNFGKLNTDHDLPLYLIKDDTLYIRRFEGITRGGQFILINEGNADAIEGISLKSLEQRYSPDDRITIILRLNVNNELVFGHPDTDEMPFRQPHSIFEILVEHIAEKNLSNQSLSDTSLPILQLVRTQRGVVVDESYIPPVAFVRAHREMLAWFYELVNINYNIAALNAETIQRLSSESHSSYLRSSATVLCTQMAFFLANNMDEFADEFAGKSPYAILSFYKKMGRVINASLVAMNNRERVIQYMADWTASTPEGFLEKLDALNEIDYNHANLISINGQIREFTKLVQNLFSKLSTLNYISEK
jgi:hypothetical protein